MSLLPSGYTGTAPTRTAAGTGFACAARKQSTAGGNDPDCNWPFCGCDPYASKVLDAITESGYLIAKPAE